MVGMTNPVLWLFFLVKVNPSLCLSLSLSTVALKLRATELKKRHMVSPILHHEGKTIAESSHYRVAFSVFVLVYPFCSVMCQTGEHGTVFPEVAVLGALRAAVDLTRVWCLWCDNN